jgi:hypothetical protein
MGLLDNLYVGHGASFGGQGGGLLDFLRATQMQNQQYQPMETTPWPASPPVAPAPAQPAGPIGIGDYQMPRMGQMAQFTPPPEDPAALPPNAQPVQGQMPAPEPGMGSNAMTGLQSFLNGGGLISSIRGAAEGRRVDPRGMAEQQANQTERFLVSKGMDPAMAKTVLSDPVLTRAVLPQIMGLGGGQTDDIKEYQFAKKEDPTLTFQKFMQQKKAVSGEYSLTPQFGTNEKGETVMIQTGKSGSAIQTVLPAGVKLSSGVDKIDLGSSWGIIDKKTGQMVGQQAKDIEGKEAAEERGKAKGLAQVALPNVIANAEQTLQTIKSIKEDPYRQRGTGLSSVFNAIPATGGYDFAQKLEQLKGKTFLEAFQQLKGGGAITEIEGKKAESAIARLSAGQSEGAFLEAVNELETIVTAGIERAKARAGQGGQPAQAAPAAPDRAAIEAELRRRGKL